MQTFEYNGVSFPFIKTEEFGSDPKYVHGSYSHTEVRIGISATLSKDIPDLVKEGETWGEALRRIKHAMEFARKPLKVTVDDTALVECSGPDVLNGPVPGPFQVTEFVGTESALVRFSVTAYLNECDRETGEVPKYLSHTFKESITVDDSIRTTRTRTGTLKVRAEFRSELDSLRGVTCPPIPPGFMRDRSVYTIAEDGLSLAYEFVDKEVWAVPPAPSVKASGSFTVTSLNGASVYGEAQVELTGDPKCDKLALVETAMAVALERIQRASPVIERETNSMILTGSMREDLYEPRVSVSLRTMLKPYGATPIKNNSLDSSTYSDGLRLATNPSLAVMDGGLVARSAARLTGLFTGANESVRQAEEAEFAKANSAKPGTDTGGNATGPKGMGPGGYGFGLKPKYSESGTLPPDPGLRGAAGLRLVAAALQDPCLARTLRESERASAPANPFGPRGTTLNSLAQDVLNLGRNTLTETTESEDSSSLSYGSIDGTSAVGFTPTGGTSGSGNTTTQTTGSTNYSATSANDSSSFGAIGSILDGLAGSTSTEVNAELQVTDDLDAYLETATPEELGISTGGIYSDYRLRGRYIVDRQIASSVSHTGKAAAFKMGPDKIHFELEWSIRRAADIIDTTPFTKTYHPHASLLKYEYSPGEVELAADGVTMVTWTGGKSLWFIMKPDEIKGGALLPPWISELVGTGHKPTTSMKDGPVLVKSSLTNPPNKDSDGKPDSSIKSVASDSAADTFLSALSSFTGTGNSNNNDGEESGDLPPASTNF